MVDSVHLVTDLPLAKGGQLEELVVLLEMEEDKV